MGGCGGRALEATVGVPVNKKGKDKATEASSRTQILAPPSKSSPLSAPPGPLKLRLFGEHGISMTFEILKSILKFIFEQIKV